MIYEALETAAKARHLTILGGFHPNPDDNAPPGCNTLILLGPDEPQFWPAFAQTPEWKDGVADPMDSWSQRVIGAWANQLGAQALYPFGGPPFQPFFTWALRTGRINASPIMLLVHDQAGLFVSFRGALAFSEQLDLPAPPKQPCTTCSDKPCTTACPVDAFQNNAYDVPACKSFLGTSSGQTCMSQGCASRRACPVSQQYGRLPAQSAYHMKTYKG
ncbi:MAG: ferredoxin [Roseobacter sp.]